MNPKFFESYLQPPLDLAALEARVVAVTKSRDLGPEEKEAVEAFQRGMSIIHRGGDPGSPFANLDLENG
jgi:hypothetical protein